MTSYEIRAAKSVLRGCVCTFAAVHNKVYFLGFLLEVSKRKTRTKYTGFSERTGPPFLARRVGGIPYFGHSHNFCGGQKMGIPSWFWTKKGTKRMHFCRGYLLAFHMRGGGGLVKNVPTKGLFPNGHSNLKTNVQPRTDVHTYVLNDVYSSMISNFCRGLVSGLTQTDIRIWGTGDRRDRSALTFQCIIS